MRLLQIIFILKKRFFTLIFMGLIIWGGVSPSYAALDWISAPSPTTDDLIYVTYVNDRFLAVSSQGALFTSSDGIDWAGKTDNINIPDFQAIAYGNGQYVAIDMWGGKIYSSPDSMTWTLKHTSKYWLAGIAYANGLFVAAGGSIASSPDGLTWTESASGFPLYNYSGFGFLNGKFYAVGDDIIASNDGYVWSTVLMKENTPGHLYGIAYGNNTYVTSFAGTLLTSADGTTWQQVTPGVAIDWRNNITFGNGYFVAMGGGNILVSTDGQQWTTVDAGKNIWKVAFGNGRFVAVGKGGLVMNSGVALMAGNINVVKGETRQTNVTLTSVDGFNSAMNLTYAWQGNEPANATVNITPESVTPLPSGATAKVAVSVDVSTAVGSYTLSVTASGGGTTAFVNIQVTVANTLAFSTDPSISSVKGEALAPILTVGGIGAPTFSLASGALPPGVTFNPDGTFSDAPTTRGTYTFTVKASDTDSHDVVRQYSVRVYDPAYRHLVLDAASWDVQRDAITGWITVKVLDDYGSSVIATQPATIDISSSSLTGRFSTDGASWSADNTLSPDISAGSSSKRFKHKDSTAGTFTITVAGVAGTPSEGWEAASNAIIVGGAVPFNLAITKSGAGTGQITTSSGTIIWNGNTGAVSYAGGTSVTLTAIADTSATFAGWGGDCSGTGTCTLGMYGDRNVTATFNTVAADTTPPTNASIVINGGAASTGSQQATLTLSATDPSGLGQMRFSNDNLTWSDPIAFANTASWSLTQGDGEKKVWAKFSDSLNNWMEDVEAVFDTIILSTTIVPANPSGLEIVGVEPGSISLKWNKNPEEAVTYHVFRSQTANGVFYRVNTAPIDFMSFTMEFGVVKVNFIDRALKEGQTYYYQIQAVSGGVTSAGFSNVASAKTLTVEDYVVNVIDPTNIVSIGNMVKYYIQLLPRDKFKGTISLSLAGVPPDVTPDFIVNGETKGSSVTGLTLPATVTLQVTAGSATVAKEYRFQLIAQNFWTGGSSDPREASLSLTVLPRDGAGIHVEVEKTILRKGEKVKIYGSILPTTETNRTVVLTLTPSGGSAQTKNVTTAPGGKFEDGDWISTLGTGTYTLTGAWKDSQSNQHTSAARSFTVEKGDVALTCLRKTGVQPTVGSDYTVMGSMKPVIPYTPLTLQVEDPDGAINRQLVALDGEGQYARSGNFFAKNGIWKFKVYFAGNDDYIGAESDELVVPVGIDFGRAIILGGGEASQSNTYWEVTKKLTVAAYRDFKAKGFLKEMIYYMINSQTVDINYDDIPDDVVNVMTPTVNAFLDAIRIQYATVLDAQTPLFIYMQGHATQDKRFKILGSEEYLTSLQMKDALDKLQGIGAYQGQGGAESNIIVIIETCYSGNFIADLSGPRRVIVTSAGDEPYNTDSSGQISFSRRLFSKLLEGDSLKKAFDYARTTQVNMNYPAPRLDDNGDGTDNQTDGLLAANIHLNGALTWGLKPIIGAGAVGLAPVIEGVDSTPISVNVTQGDVNIERVWAQIIAPNANIGGGTETIAYPEIALTLNAATQRYEGTLAGLTVSGIYKIVVLARDANKEVSDPALAYITVASPPMPGDVNGDGNVTLADAILAMQFVVGKLPPAGAIQEGYAPSTGDVNKDGKISLVEVIYILQKVAEIR